MDSIFNRDEALVIPSSHFIVRPGWSLLQAFRDRLNGIRAVLCWLGETCVSHGNALCEFGVAGRDRHRMLMYVYVDCLSTKLPRNSYFLKSAIAMSIFTETSDHRDFRYLDSELVGVNDGSGSWPRRKARVGKYRNYICFGIFSVCAGESLLSSMRMSFATLEGMNLCRGWLGLIDDWIKMCIGTDILNSFFYSFM